MDGGGERPHHAAGARGLGTDMIRLLTVIMISAAIAPTAFADPCEAKLPTKVGATFSGTVKYVGDGDSLCVGKTNDPNEWIEVRLLDFEAPELDEPDGPKAKSILEAQALGKAVTCTVDKGRIGRTVSWDRVFAVCRVGTSSVGDLMRQAGAPTG